MMAAAASKLQRVLLMIDVCMMYTVWSETRRHKYPLNQFCFGAHAEALRLRCVQALENALDCEKCLFTATARPALRRPKRSPLLISQSAS